MVALASHVDKDHCGARGKKKKARAKGITKREGTGDKKKEIREIKIVENP